MHTFFNYFVLIVVKKYNRNKFTWSRQIEFMGEVTAGLVIFGPDDCEPLLGVTAVESVGIVIDPTNKTLKRLPAIPLK